LALNYAGFGLKPIKYVGDPEMNSVVIF